MSAVKPRMHRWVARAVASGRAMAMFLGTSSPKIMVEHGAENQADAERERCHGALGHSGSDPAARR